MEADLMCELLKQGAKHYDDIIQLSSVIRMCALGLVDLTLAGNQSMVSAAARMVSAYLPPVNMCLTLTSIDPFLFCKLPAHTGTGRKLMVVFNSRLWQVRPKRCVIG